MVEIIWAYKTVLIWIGVSLLFFLFSLAAVSWLVARIPATYFRDLAMGGKPDKEKGEFRVSGFVGRCLKNLLGVVLIIAGIIMLFVPGQGLLTLLVGMVLIDFPGKTKLLLFLVGTPSVQDGLNWIRRKKGVLPLVFPGDRTC